MKYAGVAAAIAAAGLVAVCLVPHERTVDPIRPRPDTQYWRMSGGYSIAYTRVPARGPAGKAPIVFLHGGPGGYIHTSIIETLGPLSALGHDLYFYDQIGSGLSDRLRPKQYTVLRNVEDLREIVERHLAAERVILVGQSYGATLAAHFMGLHPDLVERAVFTSPGSLDPTLFEDGRWVNLDKYPTPDSLQFVEPEEFIHLTFVRQMSLRTIASLALATLFDVRLMGDEEADGVLNTLISRIGKGLVCDPANVLPEEGGGGFYSHYLGNWYGDLDDPRPRLARLDTPVLVLQGQCDFHPYAGAYEFADLFPDGEYRFIEGAGHEIWWDRPDEFFEEIRGFLAAGP